MSHKMAEAESYAPETTSDVGHGLESEQFRRFLDKIPFALLVANMKGGERIVYANPEFEKLSGQTSVELVGRSWDALHGWTHRDEPDLELGAAIAQANDFVGTFSIERAGKAQTVVDAYSNIILDEDGSPLYRLAALIRTNGYGLEERTALEKRIIEKETLLFEVQHRVKNNLQMITALIRLEARSARGKMDTAPFDRLAGRIESIRVLYTLLSEHGHEDEVDLGTYLSAIASAAMQAHVVGGIRLDLKVDAYPVSVNVAMPCGLVVNELLMNAVKHAFPGRDNGTITLHSLADGDGFCRIVVSDNGVGLPEGSEWPRHGKLSSMIIQSLLDNAKATLDVSSSPGQGLRVTIRFRCSSVTPAAAHGRWRTRQ